MNYPVTTIGDIEEAAPCCDACAEGLPCAPANDVKPTIAGIDDVTILLNPFAWGVQKLFGSLVAKATGKDPAAAPTALDQMARALGVKPIELAIGLTGYTGLGRYETAAKVVGGAAVVGAAAYFVARRMKSKRKKGKRG